MSTRSLALLLLAMLAARGPAATPASPAAFLTQYAFPKTVDLAGRYLFYLHGKIIEDQGIPAVRPDFGEYEYQAILEDLSSHAFIVISEQRAKDTEAMQYAGRLAEQVKVLLQAGVPAKHITIVGASKGAGIAVYASHELRNPELKYVLLGICHTDTVAAFVKSEITLTGNVLSIYDDGDELAESCKNLFGFSEGKGLNRHAEIALQLGMRHGFLFHPLKAWIEPTIEWSESQ